MHENAVFLGLRFRAYSPSPAPPTTVETVQTWFVEVAALFVGIALGDSVPLLENLRRELRRELRLEEAAPRRTWLTVERDAGWSSEAKAVRRHLASAPVPPPVASEPEASGGLDRDVHRLVIRLVEVIGEPAGSRSLTELAAEARDRRLITADTAKAIEGLDVMRGLAAHHPVSGVEETEFRLLVNAVLYTITDPP